MDIYMHTPTGPIESFSPHQVHLIWVAMVEYDHLRKGHRDPADQKKWDDTLNKVAVVHAMCED